MTRRLPSPRSSGTIRLADGDESYVYRALCRCVDVLYVGVTRNLCQRLHDHVRAGAKWERKMARLEWDLFATREAAERVEAHLIRTLDPAHNIQGRSRAHRRPRWVDLPALAPPPSWDERARAAHRRLARGDRV